MRVGPGISESDYRAAYLEDWRRSDHASARDSGRGFLYREERVVKAILDADCRTVLDVGCSDGYLSRLLVRRGKERGVDVAACLCDVHEEILQFARRNVLQENPAIAPRGICGVAEAIPLGEFSFDAVTATEVVEHVRDPKAFVSALRSLATRRVFLTTPVGGDYDDPMHLWHWADEGELGLGLGLEIFRSISIERIPSQASDTSRVFLVEAIP